jgi:hypothetical protein
MDTAYEIVFGGHSLFEIFGSDYHYGFFSRTACSPLEYYLLASWKPGGFTGFLHSHRLFGYASRKKHQ